MIMVPQIIYITLQLLGGVVLVNKYVKEKNWYELNWFIIGTIITTTLLCYGGFYNVFIPFL